MWRYRDENGFYYTGRHCMTAKEGEKTPHWSYFGDNGWLRTNQRLTLSGIKYNADSRGWLTTVR